MKTDPSPSSPPKWTRGPLSLDGFRIVSEHGTVATVAHDQQGLRRGAETSQANAARLASCWNALLPIESPEDFVREVREALENAEVWLANSMPVVEPNSTKPLPQIRRLLSLLNGKKKDER